MATKYQIWWQTRQASSYLEGFDNIGECEKIVNYLNGKVNHFALEQKPTPIFWWIVAYDDIIKPRYNPTDRIKLENYYRAKYDFKN